MVFYIDIFGIVFFALLIHTVDCMGVVDFHVQYWILAT